MLNSQQRQHIIDSLGEQEPMPCYWCGWPVRSTALCRCCHRLVCLICDRNGTHTIGPSDTEPYQCEFPTEVHMGNLHRQP